MCHENYTTAKEHIFNFGILFVEYFFMSCYLLHNLYFCHNAVWLCRHVMSCS